MKQNIQKALHALLALMLILTSVSIPVQANEDPAAAAEQNIALNKPTNTSGGQGERAVDGDLSTYWDGGVYPGELLDDDTGGDIMMYPASRSSLITAVPVIIIMRSTSAMTASRMIWSAAKTVMSRRPVKERPMNSLRGQ